MHRILLIDDDAGVLGALARMLASHPIATGGAARKPRVDTFTSSVAALDHARRNDCDLVICDYRMPALDGVQTLRRMREIQPDCVRVMLSGQAGLHGVVDAINEARIDRFVAKPWDDAELVDAIAGLLQARARQLPDAASDRGPGWRRAAEARRLERLEPGITRVDWEPDGSLVITREDIVAGSGHEH